MTNTTKRCPRCGETKDRKEGFGANGWCRVCHRDRARERYRNDPAHRERTKADHKERERKKRADPERNAVTLAKLREKRLTNPEWRDKTLAAVTARRRRFVGRDLAIQARKRAERDGRDCTITPELVQAMWEREAVCVYCGGGLVVGTKVHTHQSPTLDRKDQSKGYTPENTALACFRCNTLKRDATLEELESLVANLRRVVCADA